MDIDAGPFLLTAAVPPGRVGAQLAELRTRLGLSRRQLATRLGVNRWWVRRWELGTHRLPDPVVRRLLSELGLALEELIPQRLPLHHDAASQELVLASSRAPIDPAAGNLAVLRAYVELVTRVRATPPAGGWELRSDDLAVLVDLLDLGAADLEAHLAEVFALDPANAEALGGRLRRQRVAAASAVAAGLLAITPNADAATATSAAPAVTSPETTVVHVAAWQAPLVHADVTVEHAGTVLATVLPFASAAPATPVAPEPVEPPATALHEGDEGTATAGPADPADPAAAVDPATEIGDAVTIERPAVEIADAVTIERPAAEIADAVTIERPSETAQA